MPIKRRFGMQNTGLDEGSVPENLRSLKIGKSLLLATSSPINYSPLGKLTREQGVYLSGSSYFKAASGWKAMC